MDDGGDFLKVFLTGATGFIGKPLTRQLLQRGWQVTALVRNPEGPQSRVIAAMGAKLVKGDVTDKESMRAGMTGSKYRPTCIPNTSIMRHSCRESGLLRI